MQLINGADPHHATTTASATEGNPMSCGKVCALHVIKCDAVTTASFPEQNKQSLITHAMLSNSMMVTCMLGCPCSSLRVWSALPVSCRQYCHPSCMAMSLNSVLTTSMGKLRGTKHRSVICGYCCWVNKNTDPRSRHNQKQKCKACKLLHCFTAAEQMDRKLPESDHSLEALVAAAKTQLL